MHTAFHDMLVSLECQDKKILVAVSGGLDSVVLLHLFSRTDLRVSIAHANFQLRGSASDQDEEFVRNLADDYKMGFYSQRFPTNNYAIEQGISIQMAARDLRYQWFDELLDRAQYDFVATGHHANDNLETALINFSRGTGIKGLTGMEAKNGRVIRPLLGIPRKEMEDYATVHHLVWREDASNASNDYTRNFIRHEVVPKLKEINPSLEETFNRNSERLKLAEHLALLEIVRIRERHPRTKEGTIEYPKAMLIHFKYPGPLLFELLQEEGFNISQCYEMAAAAKGQSGKKFLSETHQVVLDRTSLFVIPIASEAEAVLIQREDRMALRAGSTIFIGKGTREAGFGDSRTATIDGSRLLYPLVWRTWRAGDAFMPFGMDSRKKVSDFLIDKKIPLHKKQQVSVLESGNDIIWVVGHRPDNRYRVTAQTSEVITFRLE